MPKDDSEPVLRSDTNKTNLQKIQAINVEFKERDIKANAKKSGVPYIDLKTAPLSQDALRLTNWELVQTTQSIPFDLSGIKVHLAAVEPTAEKVKNFVQELIQKGYEVEQYVCSQEGIESSRHYFENILATKEVQIQTKVEETGIAQQDFFAQDREAFEKSNGPEMLNRLNLGAIRFHASDIHFQPEKDVVRVRMRRDGEMYETLRLSLKQYVLISSEIKRVANLKINLKATPQDGNYQFTANERQISVRVSALPSKYGESLVLRILDARNAMVQLADLGFSEENKKIISETLLKDRGLILVTGPTGSGKTSTLYSCLNVLNTSDRKIITLEDPIEYELKNIIQSEIQEEEGYTFASGLRAVLRQDPDVIMVGEIRDKEAAEIALQASLTGHLVLSTVHSNDAIATIPRLYDMGVKDYILASGLELIIAQRLVRKICDNCKIPGELSDSVRADIEKTVQSLQKKGVSLAGDIKVFTGKGCDQCAGTAYQGRIAIAEVLSVNDTIRKSITAGETADVLLQKAEGAGFITMKEDGIRKVLEGKTTIEEVWRVLV